MQRLVCPALAGWAVKGVSREAMQAQRSTLDGTAVRLGKQTSRWITLHLSLALLTSFFLLLFCVACTHFLEAQRERSSQVE